LHQAPAALPSFIPLMCINRTIGRAVIVNLHARTRTMAIKSLPSGDSPFQASSYP
jgi:hypothetical protein